MSTQIFSTAQACADEIAKLRAQGVACRLQKVEGGGFTVVLMNGKAQPQSKTKAKTDPAPHIQIRQTLDGGVWCNKGAGFYPVVKFTLDEAIKALTDRSYVKTDKNLDTKNYNTTWEFSLKSLVEKDEAEEWGNQNDMDDELYMNRNGLL
jgi:hypothetical protein